MLRGVAISWGTDVAVRGAQKRKRTRLTCRLRRGSNSLWPTYNLLSIPLMQSIRQITATTFSNGGLSNINSPRRLACLPLCLRSTSQLSPTSRGTLSLERATWAPSYLATPGLTDRANSRINNSRPVSILPPGDEHFPRWPVAHHTHSGAQPLARLSVPDHRGSR